MKVFLVRGWSSPNGVKKMEEELRLLLKDWDIDDVKIVIGHSDNSFVLIVMLRDSEKKWKDFPDRVIEE